jgi:D-alanyl-D-alanine endopeptidase (penicillin-binding protein 7)
MHGTVVVFRTLVFVLLGLLSAPPSWAAVSFGSAHVVVIDESNGEILLEKDAGTAAPIASLTKLMTAMVVLDAQQDPNEPIRIEEADLDWLKHTRSGLRVGAVGTRAALIELALIASDNHAAAALARAYPGGLEAFVAATQRKVEDLGLTSTSLEEPTGLSAANHASALDMAKVVQATANYPLIAEITSKRTHSVSINGRLRTVHNTNGLVGRPGWEILTSKTGFTNDAGRCLTMRLRAAGRTVTVVLIGAVASSVRSVDALNIRRWLAGDPPVARTPQRVAGRHGQHRHAPMRPTVERRASL